MASCPPRPAALFRAFAAAAAALLMAGCTPLGVFATFTPRDPALRAAMDQTYGDQPRQRLDLYAPRRIDVARPVAVFIYGGGWETGRKWDYGWVAQALAAKGYVVVLPDYRLHPQVRFPVFLEDGAKAVRWAVDHAPAYGGDPSRIVLLGHSAGAYNAVMLGLDRSYLSAAGVDPARIKAVVGIAGPYEFLPLEGHMEHVFGSAPDPQATQPGRFARADAPPMLLITGDADQEVNPGDTTALTKTLRAAGAPAQERHYPQVGHNEIMAAISRPFRGRASVLDDITTFMDQETK